MLKHYSHNAEWSITDFYLISDGIYMKHQKEWHTCDRCGAEINENERSMFLKKVYRISGLLVRKYAYEKLNAFDLCPKCRKDFEEFMRNE